ncbi:hypothetical protein GCM10007216_33560 [Thalassobacillus devorans]|uniref:Uncharacterized protein n=1 Tax=Thalassobacillus devorans TaxID=279813 RepID=A0ABQ1PNH7_9BACI|nr:hypothetical protein [Thalassobacillus devorans]NIK30460.1 hypothetical protein [Thalassobacillus devorans]GGD00114.1 hypothetical protein GCM10007216_33560 [Thalassobacillus devorans]
MEKKEALPLQMECTMFFQSNPYMIESLAGLENRLGRRKEDLQPVLELLVQQGIIRKTGKEPKSLYRYNEPMVITEMNIPDTLESP